MDCPSSGSRRARASGSPATRQTSPCETTGRSRGSIPRRPRATSAAVITEMPTSAVCSGIIDSRDVVAGRDLVVVERNAATEVSRDEFVIAGENLHGHAVALEFPEHLRDVRQCGVGEADEAGQDQISLVVTRVGVFWFQPTIGDRQGTRKPSALNPSWTVAHSRRVAASSDATRPSASNAVDRPRIGSGAPLVMRSRRSARSGVSTTTDRRRRSKSKGMSSIL
jgi:hypothetical protein